MAAEGEQPDAGPATPAATRLAEPSRARGSYECCPRAGGTTPAHDQAPPSGGRTGPSIVRGRGYSGLAGLPLRSSSGVSVRTEVACPSGLCSPALGLKKPRARLGSVCVIA